MGVGRAPGIDLVAIYNKHNPKTKKLPALRKQKPVESEFMRNYNTVSPNVG